MILSLCVVSAALWLAWSNGANDNFKGVATLYGSQTTTYRNALIWATAATATGSAVSLVVARSLALTFSGKGLIPSSLAGTPELLLAVGFAAALTIFLATRLGMPTSTTHSLIGGLLGAGLAAHGSVNGSVLVTKFAIPMLSSPLIAIVLAAMGYLAFRGLRRTMGITKETCICVTDGSIQPVNMLQDGSMVMASTGLTLTVDDRANCMERYAGTLAGVDAQSAVNGLHFFSAGAVCFSRAVNDTPKIAALLLTLPLLGTNTGLILIAVAMALGGWVQSRRVAETMSNKITDLNGGQGLAANLTTAFLVLFASKLGVPVSTTHVSCGSIFGIGIAGRSCRWRTILGILTAWITTLPFAAVVSALIYLVIR